MPTIRFLWLSRSHKIGRGFVCGIFSRNSRNYEHVFVVQMAITCMWVIWNLSGKPCLKSQQPDLAVHVACPVLQRFGDLCSLLSLLPCEYILSPCLFLFLFFTKSCSREGGQRNAVVYWRDARWSLLTVFQSSGRKGPGLVRRKALLLNAPPWGE